MCSTSRVQFFNSRAPVSPFLILELLCPLFKINPNKLGLLIKGEGAETTEPSNKYSHSPDRPIIGRGCSSSSDGEQKSVGKRPDGR